ncbi:MAG: hypothetical protein AB7S86_04430 [Hydrogenophaga sp.]|uniref:hypothetical protein n=1 Tax=Hydrogenophaga sp. TaxID=1904254 RepID=UPI003D0CBA1C
MNPFHRNLTCTLALSALLASCAAPPSSSSSSDAGAIKVIYSQIYPDGSILKEKPSEIRMVTRDATSKNVAAQVGLNAVLLAMGAFSFRGFSKDDLKGSELTDVADRSHLQNPVPTEFVGRLQARVDAFVQTDESLQKRRFERPLIVGGGNVRLVYESLLGTEEEKFRLKTDLVVYKKRESSAMASLMAPVVVECSGKSPDAWPQSRWAQENYLLVKVQLDELLQACETKVQGNLHQLLNG